MIASIPRRKVRHTGRHDLPGARSGGDGYCRAGAHHRRLYHLGGAPPSQFRSHLSSIWHEDLQANPPQYVLIGDQAAPDTKRAMVALGMEQLLSEEYTELPEVAGYQVYERMKGFP